MIVRNFVGLAHAADELEHTSDVAVLLAQQRGNVEHTRRPKPLGPAEQRRDFLPNLFVRRRETDFVAGQPYPSSVQRDLFVANKALKN
jgi:hypothetical protein